MKPPPLTNRQSVPPLFRPPCAPHQIHKKRDPKNDTSFVVELRLPSSDPRHRVSLPSLGSILDLSSVPQPQLHHPYPSGPVFAALFYREFSDARDALVSLWRHRFFNSIPTLSPSFVSSFPSTSQQDELHDSLKTVFLERIEALQDGDEVNNLQNKVTQINDEIHKLEGLMRRRQLVRVFIELRGRHEGLVAERSAIVNRLKEFNAAMSCIRAYLEGKWPINENDVANSFWVFKFDSGKKVDWIRIHNLMCRESRRLDGGLPIYAHRLEILERINLNQVQILCKDEVFVL